MEVVVTFVRFTVADLTMYFRSRSGHRQALLPNQRFNLTRTRQR